MNNKENIYDFPKVKKSINDFIQDEEGNVTRGKLVTVGTMIVIMSIVSSLEAFAAHGSHVSHSSHASHSSGAYSKSYSGTPIHGSHTSHASHNSHTSHSNSISHSNSLYSSEGDVSYAPAASNIVFSAPTQQTISKLPNITFDAKALENNMPTFPNLSEIESVGKTANVGMADIGKTWWQDILSKLENY